MPRLRVAIMMTSWQPAEVDVDVSVLCVRDDGDSDETRLDAEKIDDVDGQWSERRELGHADTGRRVNHYH